MTINVLHLADGLVPGCPFLKKLYTNQSVMSIKKEEVVYLERKTSRSRYDKRLIIKIVNEIESGVPKQIIEKEYGIRQDRVLKWLRTYGSQEYAQRVTRVYTTSEKRSVVRAVEGGMTVKEAQVAFNISNPTVIRNWLSAFEKENVEIGVINTIDMPKNKIEASGEREKALLAALDEANLKIRALDTLIDIAEDQLKISIRKKSGAKQSPK